MSGMSGGRLHTVLGGPLILSMLASLPFFTMVSIVKGLTEFLRGSVALPGAIPLSP